jgi:hypothetical protein
LSDVKVIINLLIDYDISCVSCDGPTTTTTTTCLFNEFEIQLGSPCTFYLYDCDGTIFDTISFVSGGTYTICAASYGHDICAVSLPIILGPCNP